MAVPSCRFFSGYKPCSLSLRCDLSCPKKDLVDENILLIHLGAMGAVVRSTSLLDGLKKKHPHSKLIWLTERPSLPLLENNPFIDQVIAADFDGLMALSNFHFSAVYVVDKSLKATGFTRFLSADRILGFTADTQGAILPANLAATELWQLGLDNQQKFFENSKPETRLVSEALEIPYSRSEYSVPLRAEEVQLMKQRRNKWSHGHQKIIVGLNTGCSPTIPYKKLSVEFQRKIAEELQTDPRLNVVLLGGPEDNLRNQEIGRGLPIINSETQQGLRDGLISVAACDIVVTGDSLGMHMALSQRKWIVAWFGPTCAQEIDLFDRGVKILSKANCSPCWKRSCQKATMCYDQVDLQEIINGVNEGIQFWRQTSLSRQPFSEIFYSAFHF